MTMARSSDAEHIAPRSPVVRWAGGLPQHPVASRVPHDHDRRGRDWTARRAAALLLLVRMRQVEPGGPEHRALREEVISEYMPYAGRLALHYAPGREYGGTIHTGLRINDIKQIPSAEVTLLDLDPGQVASLYGDRLPARVRSAYRRFRRGPAAYKLDLAVEGGVPWTNERARRAGTVHLGGSRAEGALSQSAVAVGRMPERPFVLVGQQYLADPCRSVGDVHPVWAYAHVPHGYDGNATDAVIRQLERFAPGVRERIVGSYVTRPADFASANPNFLGGDILTGSKTPRQLLLGARPTLDPYSTGIPGVYLCSAATPPGPGAHGMCGAGAAKSALRHLGIRSR
jgi:phytoene dehydrogenase-like protein